MTKQYKVTINAPMEKVFLCLDDKEKMEQWLYGQVKTEFKTSTDFSNPVGTKFHQKFGPLIDIDGEVLAFRAPVELGIGIKVAGLTGTAFYNLEEIDQTHTKLNFTLDLIDSTMPKRILLQALMPMFNRTAKTYLESIKELAENT